MKKAKSPEFNKRPKATHKFSKKTLDFLVKAAKQKNPDWLDKNSNEYETVLKGPFIYLAETIKNTMI